MCTNDKILVAACMSVGSGALLLALVAPWFVGLLCGVVALFCFGMAALAYYDREAGQRVQDFCATQHGVCHPHREEVPITARFDEMPIAVENWPMRKKATVV